jgi:predicted secreted protein
MGVVLKGTQAGAPEVHDLRKKAIITTGVSLILWLLITILIVSEIVTIEDIDLFGRMVEENKQS